VTTEPERREIMKRQIMWIAILLMAFNVSLAADDEAVAAAKTVANSWLAQADSEDFGGSWTSASSLFRAAVTQAEWERALNVARGPLGKLISRELGSADFYTTLPGAPDGEYVVMQFNSSFAHKATAVETVTVMLDNDGSWRISGYYIR
jgi:hypothetical protein